MTYLALIYIIIDTITNLERFKEMGRRRFKQNRSIQRGESLGYQAAIVGAVMSAALLGSYGCSYVSGTEDGAADTAKASGFTDVTVTDTKRFLPGLRGCDRNDSVGFSLEARNTEDQPVTLTVCSALFKGDTIRNTMLVPAEDQDATATTIGMDGNG